MKRIILFTAVLFSCVGCDIILPDNRLIPIDNTNVEAKKVLLLDFTDQNCNNCIHATVEIEKLKERFADTLVAVSIHANPLPYPLVTTEGKEYERHFHAEDHPAGVIDGGGSGEYMSHDPQLWGGFIIERLKSEPAVIVSLSANFDKTANEALIDVEIKGNKAIADVSLQLWIIEHNVKNWQLMLDGTRNSDYIHHHVFRASVNGTWGESFAAGTDEKINFHYACILHENWKPEDVMIVGFVYHPKTGETLNVQEISLINKIE